MLLTGYWQGHPVNIAKLCATDRVALSVSQNWTLLTGSPCQQCIIDKENINQSEVRDDAANRSRSYTCCLLSFSNTMNDCVSLLPVVHSMCAASWYSYRPRLSDWKGHGKLILYKIVLWISELEISYGWGGAFFFFCKLIVHVKAFH